METCVSVHIWSKLFFVLFKHLFTAKHTNVITRCNMSKLGYPTQSWPDFAWISDADNDKVLMSLTKLSWSLCFASHEISFHTKQFESESSLCVMSHALCNSQQLPFFFSGFRTFGKKNTYTYCIISQNNVLYVQQVCTYVHMLLACRVPLHNDKGHYTQAFCQGRLWCKQQVCNRSFSSGHWPARGQISREAEHRWSLPVVHKNWTAEMSPFHQRYRTHSSSDCLLSQPHGCISKTLIYPQTKAATS